MASAKRPRALRPGGTIGIAAPAGPVDPARLAEGEARLRDAGFRVVRRGDVEARSGYLAGDDDRRAKELADLVADPEVDAIVCARGGYGCHRIVSRLDPEAFRRAGKPLAGFSDVTTLLLWQLRCAGLAGLHGPMPGRAARPEDLGALVRLLCGEPDAPWQGRPGGGGRAEGPLVGGNLTVLVASLGCPWEPDLRGAILLVEDVGERPYRLDRLMAQLRAAGRLDDLAGVGVGSLAACDDDRYPSPGAAEVMEESLAGLGVPVLHDLPFGHGAENRPWPFGGRARIDGDGGTLEMLDSGVEIAE